MTDKHFFAQRDDQLGLLIWFRLARFFHQSIRLSTQHLKKWDLSVSQFDLLAQIGAHQPLSQNELAAKLFVTKGNVTQVVSKMEENGYIERQQEWRTKMISLTAKGEQLFQEVVPQQGRFQAMQFQGLNTDEQKQLLHLLKKLQIENKE